jgi:AAA+ superfamily predicted ATPase
VKLDTTGKQCFFMICKNETKQECLDRNLFGGLEWQLTPMKQIRKGDIGLLINLSNNELIGIFEARGNAQLNIEPEAWQGKFPAQVRVHLLGTIQGVSKAIEKLSNIGVGMTTIKSGAHVPKFPVHSQDILDKVLVLFSHTPQVTTQVESIPQLPSKSDKLKFDNIAGLNDIKQFIRERMIEPAIDFELAKRFRLRLGGGLLLYGPPGTGKTLIAQATAGELDAEFIEISPSVIRGFPGDAEKKIEELFLKLLTLPRAVVFIDEAEALLAQRESQTSSVMERITPVLLAQFSKLSKNRYKPVLTIAATNSPWKIDSAFLRPGRLDKLLYVGPPDQGARVALLQLCLQERPISDRLRNNETLVDIATRLEGYTGADIEQIVDHAALEAYRETIKVGSNVESCITEESLQRACAVWPKSVNKDVIKQYLEWGGEFGNFR